MSRTTFPPDRFDEIPADQGRVGAHRATNPRMRGWVVMSWAVVATGVLIVVGIFGSLIVSGRVTPFPAPVASTPPPVAVPVVDTTYSVLVLNATPQAGLATQARDLIIGAGWPSDIVTAGDAGSEDFGQTTVYYPFPEDEAAASGLAQNVLGGARVVQSAAYQPPDDPGTEIDESFTRQLAVVIGLDRTAAPPPPTGP